MFGSKGSLRLEGMTHVAGASSEERRTRLFSTAKWQPIKGPALVEDPWATTLVYPGQTGVLDRLGNLWMGSDVDLSGGRPPAPGAGGAGGRRG